LTIIQVANMTPPQIGALSTNQLQALTPLQLNAIPPRLLWSFSNKQLQSFTPEQVAQFTPAQLNNVVTLLNPQQLSGLNRNQLALMDNAPARMQAPPQRTSNERAPALQPPNPVDNAFNNRAPNPTFNSPTPKQARDTNTATGN